MNIPSPLRRGLGRGKPFNFQNFSHTINRTLLTQKQHDYQKGSSIDKLEEFEYVRLSKTFLIHYFQYPPCATVLLTPKGEGAFITNDMQV